MASPSFGGGVDPDALPPGFTLRMPEHLSNGAPRPQLNSNDDSGEDARTVVGSEQPSNGTRPPQNTHHHSTEDGKAIVDPAYQDPALEKTTTETAGSTDDFHRHVSNASRHREEHRLDDNLQLLRAEQKNRTDQHEKASTLGRTRSRREIMAKDDELVVPGAPASWSPPEKPTTKFAQLVVRIHQSSKLVRYFTYIVPVAVILLIPLLLGALVFPDASVGGVEMLWFCVWLMIAWLSLWGGRIIADCIPPVVSVIASVFTMNNKTWKNVAFRLKLPITLFLWWMAVFISFQSVMRNHHVDGDTSLRYWERQMNLVLLTIFVGTAMNLAEKIIIQIITLHFHNRTYEDRIQINKFQIGVLAKLYAYSRENARPGYFDIRPATSSGNRTPRAMLNQVTAGARNALRSFGDVMGKVAGDFAGREVSNSGSPKNVVMTLLSDNEGSLALARQLFRTFVDESTDTVHMEDLKKAIPDEEECESAFQLFDRDMNGDIACEEMELACQDVARERKAITAGLQDLDIVIGQLDKILVVIVILLCILLFVSLISDSTASVLSSASALVLAFSFAFSATAQEIVNAILFVFVKHPFDVGDRIDIFDPGNLFQGATYYVKNFSLLYTELKKPEGHIVQMPNSLLNTVVILNMRRTGSNLAEAIPVYLKFGTTLEQIEALRDNLLEFVKAEKRDYAPKILTELKDLQSPMWEVKLNIVFFYKTNWQNEILRLHRRNKIICAIMQAFMELGIESTHMRWPGHKPEAPLYLSGGPSGSMPPAPSFSGGEPMQPNHGTGVPEAPLPHGTFAQGPLPGRTTSSASATSHARSTRAADYSLGAKDMIAFDDSSDVFADRKRVRAPAHMLARVREEEENERKLERTGSRSSRDHGSTLGRPGTNGSGHSFQTHRSSLRNRFGLGKRKEEDVESEANRQAAMPIPMTGVNIEQENLQVPQSSREAQSGFSGGYKHSLRRERSPSWVG